MRVLLGCEESGTARDAFLRLGHDARSCDLQESRGEHPHLHFQQDIVECLESQGMWDLIILFPDCTAMATCGNRHYGDFTPGYPERVAAINWTKRLWKLAKTKSPRVALENPNSVIFGYLTGTTQYIQPWMFGHVENKNTGLQLYNLPKLRETENVKHLLHTVPRRDANRVHHMGEVENRKRDRAKTYDGIAAAFAAQWGSLT